MAYFPTNKLSVVLRPNLDNYKERSASVIFSGFFFAHFFPLFILYAASLLSTMWFIGLLINYFVLSYAAAVSSMGYAESNEVALHASDKTTIMQYTTLFFIAGAWPLITLQALVPAMFVVYILVVMYAFVSLATYIHFGDNQENNDHTILSDLKFFCKDKIFSENIGLIKLNKICCKKIEKKAGVESAITNYRPPTASNNFGGGRASQQGYELVPTNEPSAPYITTNSNLHHPHQD